MSRGKWGPEGPVQSCGMGFICDVVESRSACLARALPRRRVKYGRRRRRLQRAGPRAAGALNNGCGNNMSRDRGDADGRYGRFKIQRDVSV
ncbi:hypothetical protein EVAR_28109_1 [Eumeta japonica]|uniref:Uncharacterized protein n=1 Tax=Eumeta variegata TaxID=151549 RepID=A0A4C1VC92_EUMVA|nr:hypothetical protein EVAR_28109_1 [Eumeta japonica]